MAPKESSAYDYRYWDYNGNTALPLELPQDPQQERALPRKKNKPVRKSKVNTGNRTKSSMIGMMGSMALCFVIAIMLVIRSAYIAEMNFNITKQGEAYQQEIKINKELNVRLLKSVNLETLEETAFKDLKMKYPDAQKGISYVTVDPYNIIDNKDYRGYYSNADVQEKQILDSMKDYVASLTGILKN